MENEQNIFNRTLEKDENYYWRAVLQRDRHYDGVFVYAVQTTGIYCRPSCPARRPRQRQVQFFSSPEAATHAGFRPCRRCRPNESKHLEPYMERVRHACQYIRTTLESPLSLAALSRQVQCSPHHLQRTFKRITGITPRQYADALRLAQLKVRLQGGESVLDALYGAGYGSSRGL